MTALILSIIAHKNPRRRTHSPKRLLEPNPLNLSKKRKMSIKVLIHSMIIVKKVKAIMLI